MKYICAPASDAQEQKRRMTQAPVGTLIISLAIPTITSMLVTTLYNTADTFFVSQIGTSASGAVGIVFSLMAIFQAVAFTLGMGAASVIARMLGAGDTRAASEYGSTSFFLAVFMGILICIAGLLFIDPLMYLLGSTSTILPYAKDYAGWILLGAPVICSSLAMNNILRSEGKAAFAMCGLVSGGILNIILDPIFIFVFGWGIAGAASATLLSQCVSFAILYSFFFRGKSVIRLSAKNISRRPKVYWNIIKLGSPSLSRQGLAAVGTAALNTAAGGWGDAAVAAMSITGRIFMLIFSVIVGMGQGFQPVAGYNYGAGNYGRVCDAFWFLVKAGMTMMTVMAVGCFAFAPELVAFFRDDPDVIAIGARAVRFQASVLLLQPVFMSTNMLLQSTGQAGRATFLACMRQGIFFLPLIAVLPTFFGLTGVEMTQTVSDIFSCAAAMPFLYHYLKALRKKALKNA